MNRNLLAPISSLFTFFITKSYALVLILVLVLNFGITSKINAQCIGPYARFESFAASGANPAVSTASPSFTTSSTTTVSFGSSAATARSGVIFCQTVANSGWLMTPVITNPKTFSFYIKTSAAPNGPVNYLLEYSTSTDGFVTSTPFANVNTIPIATATTTLPSVTTAYQLVSVAFLTNLNADVKFRITDTNTRSGTPAPPTSFNGQLHLDDFYWDSYNSSLNNVIVPARTLNGASITNCAGGTVNVAANAVYNFYDNGGASDQYNANQINQVTFKPVSASDKIKITIVSYVGVSNEILEIWDDDGTNLVAANLLLNNNSGTIVAGTQYNSTISSNGAITIKFTSNAIGNAAGFNIKVECPSISITSLGTSSGCPGIPFTVTGTGFTNTAMSATVGGFPATATYVDATTITITPTTPVASGAVVLTNGNTVTSPTNYTVNPSPTVSAEPSVCVGSTITISPDTGGTWSSSDDTKATVTNAGIVTGIAAGSATFTFTNSTTGCSATTSSVTVNAPVNITASPSTAAQTVCVGSALTPLSVTATGGGLSYQWFSNSLNSNVGGSLIGGADSSTYTPPYTSAMATTYYYCVVSNGASCNSSVTSAVSGGITVNALPAAVNVSASGTYCTNTTLTANNGGSGTMYFQSTVSGGTFTFAPTASQVISLSGTYYFRARSALPAGCWGPEGSATVTILSVPVAPTANAATSLTTNSFTASWNSVSGATSYFLDVATDPGFTSFVTNYNNRSVGSVLTFSVTGLNPATTYYYRVRAINGTCLGLSSDSVNTTTLGLSYCTPSGATFPQDPLGITNFTLGSINNTTVIETNNYGNYTNISTDAFIGATIPLSVTLRTGFTYDTNIWIDWNNDGDFDDVGELVYSGTSASSIPTTLTGTIAVPLLNSNSASTIGSHRLRIGSIDGPGFAGGALTPCRNGAYQAFEDYTINVIPVPPCAVSTPSALTTASVTGTSATLVWSDPALTPNTIYNYWVSTTDVPPPANGSNPAGMGTVTGALTANITGLTLGVRYYFWVRVKCDATNFSDWIGSANFTTANLDVITMTNGSITSCNARFYDSGGFGSTYQNNEVFTYTFTPSPGNSLKVVFNSFDTENNYDGLMIYNGATSASPIIPSGLPAGTNATTAPADSYYGTNSPGTITTPINGSITFQFRSDGSVLLDGWDATITCVSVPTITSFTPNNACAGATPTVTLTGTNFNNPTSPITSVKFNGVDAVFTPVNSTTITATLPSGTTTGFITVSNANATGTSTQTFLVKPIPNTPNAGSDVAICSGQSTNLNATYTPATNSLLTTLIGGNGCTNGNMFNITTGTNPITVTSFDIVPNATAVQNVSVYYRVGTYVGNETTPGQWTILGTYVVNGVDKTLINMPVASLSIPASSTYGIYINYNAAYSNGTNTYSNSDITINTGAGLCAAFGSVTASRTFNGRVYYQLNLPLTYSWTPSTGLSATNISNPVASPTSTQTYTVTATSNGCASAGDSVVVTVNSVPTTTITNSASNVCANSVIAVNVTGTASTYTWTSSAANTLYSNSTGSTFYVPGTNTTIIYVKTSSTANITATGSNASGCNSTSTVTFSVSTKTFSGGLWTPGGPPLNNGTENLVFASGSYNVLTGIGLSACSCTVQGTAAVIFNAGQNLSLVNGLTVTSGSITFNNGASLVQTNDVANSGNITYKRTTTPLNKFDYTYWSTPVSPQTLSALSPLTPLHYEYDASIPQWVGLSASTTMVPGKGYISRAPSNFPLAPSSAVYNASFIGVPNNGTYTIPVFGGSDRQNLLGNPYPSAIDATLFVSDASNDGLIEATLYFWTHNTPINTGQYTGSDYAVWNILGGTNTSPSVSPGVNTSRPNGFINSGQGFFVKGIANGNVTFKNTMRVSSNNNQFFRSSNPVASTQTAIERNRFWLDIFNSEGAYKQILMGYITGGTIGLDRDFDGEMVDVGNVVTLYTMVADKKLSIQGRGLPFDVADSIPLGYKSTIYGTFTISLSDFDGLFETQNIYLEDTVTGVIHDLKSSSYVFATESGTFEDRFVLRFTPGALGVPVFTENTVVVYKNEAGLTINSGSIPMKSVAIYDVTGRLITSQKEIYATQTRFTTLPSTNQVLLVEITSETGVKVTKKVVY